uniref:Ribose-phosphate pyrophosphokinase N-terminal domain-containing protein n=1 Tax=Callithrix jacchus TaxID=9483 RepID=A0A8I3W5G3_CALJA
MLRDCVWVWPSSTGKLSARNWTWTMVVTPRLWSKTLLCTQAWSCHVVVTNTVPHEVQKLQCPKIKTVDISLILSEAIRRIHRGKSMAYLFRNITVDD